MAAIPQGLQEELPPGVIFTLRQVEGKEQNREQNPLFPYYLIYITQEGVVDLSFHQAKKILDYNKRQCAGQIKVHPNNVNNNKLETQDGTDMVAYSTLLKIVVENIIGRKEVAGIQSLFGKGGTQMHLNIAGGLEDFELVSFLVLKNDN